MRPLRAIALAAAALAAPLLAAVTHAGEPVSPDAGATLADAGADAETGPPAGTPLPVVDAVPFPEKRTPMPGNGEWAAAPDVTIHRWANALFAARGGQASNCVARRLREWVRVECKGTGGVLLLGGGADGVWLTDEERDVPGAARGPAEIEFLQEQTTFSGYRGIEEHHRSAFDFTLSEQWAPGDERPWLVAN